MIAYSVRKWRPPVDLRRRVVTSLFRMIFGARERRLAARGSLPLRGIHRILICRPNHRLGNILLLTPLLSELERIYPGAEIDVVLGSGVGTDLFAGFPRVRRVINLTPRIARHPLLLVSAIRGMRAAHYDLVIDPVRDSTSGRILSLIAHGKHFVGIAGHATTMAACATRQEQHFARLPVAAIRSAINTSHQCAGDQPCPPLSIRLTGQERASGKRIMAAITAQTGAKYVIGIFANATGRKCHDEQWWQSLIESISRQMPNLVIVEFLAADGRSRLGCRHETFYSTHLRHMAAAISAVDCFISADCGIMHLAVAADVTTIGFFSVTDPERYGPYGGLSRSIGTLGQPVDEVANRCVDVIEQICEGLPSERCPANLGDRSARRRQVS